MMIDQPPNLPLAIIRAAVQEQFGLDGTYAALAGERDQNHRLDSSDGSWVVKLCNPGEGTGIVEAQLLALAHIASIDPDLPVPRLRRTSDGALFHGLHHGGKNYPLAILSWLDGDVVGLTDLSAGQCRELGETGGRLSLALRGFVHGAPAGRNLLWNTAQAAQLLEHVNVLQDPARALVQSALEHHQDHVASRLAALPAQIMHADIHPYNTLMDTQGHVSGIIDFGDMIHAPRVIELSNAIADCLLPGRDHARVASGLVKGFVRHVPLAEDEVELILPLVRSRLALSAVLTASLLKRGNNAPQVEAPDNLSVEVLTALQGSDLESSIRYAANHAPAPRTKTSGMMQRRIAAMGPKPLLFYDDPLHVVKGEGVWLTASDGRRYLDCYNNVPHVGHSNPHVVEAIARQLRVLNTNTRYLTDEAVEYAERLKATLDPSLDTVIFVNSGSEANDVAWRMARCWTGNSGILVMDFAYHGVTEVSDAMSPSNSPAGKFSKPHVRQLLAPDIYRGPYRAGDNDLADRYADDADAHVAALKANGHGVALAIIDSAFMTNGIIEAPAGYVRSIVEKTHKAGGLFIADEVQSGFGRMGTQFWGHQHHGVVPDIVTIGKPAGNGYPIGAIIIRAEILAKFTAETGPFFSTFGGGNAASAAGLAVLEVIEREGLVVNARETGQYFRDGVRSLMGQHALIGDVRGSGLAIGVELVRDRTTREPATVEAKRVVNLLKDEGVLVGSDGKLGNVLKIRPPIVLSRSQVDLAIAALDQVLARMA